MTEEYIYFKQLISLPHHIIDKLPIQDKNYKFITATCLRFDLFSGYIPSEGESTLVQISANLTIYSLSSHCVDLFPSIPTQVTSLYQSEVLSKAQTHLGPNRSVFQ